MPSRQRNHDYTETDALNATRRVLMLLVVIVPLVLQLLLFVVHFDALSTLARAAMFLTVLLGAMGVGLSRQRAGLWLLSFTYLPVLSLTVLEGDKGPVWLPFTTHLAYTGLMWVMMLPRLLAFVAIGMLAALLYLLWSLMQPQNVFVAGLLIAGGWIQVFQTAGIAFGTWLYWHPLQAGAKRVDEVSQVRIASTEMARAVQEQLALWRRTAVGIHESLLNSIRYVLATESVEPGRLRAQMGDQIAPPMALLLADTTLRQLVDGLVHEARTWGVVVAADEVPAVTLTAESYEALRAAVGELSRNAVVHGGATEIHGGFRVGDGEVAVLVRTNQRHLPHTGGSAGMGTSLVLDAMLPQAGGHWRAQVDGYDFAVTVPTVPAERDQHFRPFDKARVLISAPLISASTAGLGYFFLLLGENRYQMFAGLAGIYVVTRLWRVLRGKILVPARQALGWSLAAASVPWLVQINDSFCEDISLISPAINIAGFAIISLGVWSPARVAFLGMLLWAGGSLIMVLGSDGVCRQSMLLPLSNALFVLPIISMATYQAVRAYERSRDSYRSIRSDESRARVRASVASEISRTLQRDLDEAQAVLLDVVAGEALDADRRRRLALLDARIRIALQVPPSTTGILTRTAAFLVREATGLGIPVRVRAVSDTAHATPIPMDAYRIMLDVMLLVEPGREASIQVWTDGECEYLTLLVPADAIAAAGLREGEQRVVGGFSVDVDESDPDSDHVAVVFSRSISPSPAPTIA